MLGPGATWGEVMKKLPVNEVNSTVKMPSHFWLVLACSIFSTPIFILTVPMLESVDIFWAGESTLMGQPTDMVLAQKMCWSIQL